MASATAELDRDDLAATGSMEMLRKLDKDLRAASRLLGRKESRWLVDTYYAIQEFRKASANQVRSGEGEPNRMLSWVYDNMRRSEDNVKRALGEFAGAYRVGEWLQSLTGIGPVLSAGFLSHLDIRKAETAGHFWRFAGLDPTVQWLSKADCKAWLLEKWPGGEGLSVAESANHWGRNASSLHRIATTKADGTPVPLTAETLSRALARRPWNARLKTLVWKAETCFVKFQNHPNDYYGKLYVQRRAYEDAKNERGEYADRAREALEKKNFGKDTDAYKAYSAGRLPPAHLLARAMRWTGKIFLSHLHHVMYLDYHDREPPVPYVFVHCPGDHRHFIPIPNLPLPSGGKRLRDLGE